MEKKIINISKENIANDIVLNTIGVDIGHSLSKIAFIEEDELILFLFNTENEKDDLFNLLLSKKELYKTINFTGGKAYSLHRKLVQDFNISLLDEFKANYNGIERLYGLTKNKNLPSSLIISIGTGTSIVYKDISIKHLGGTALGGGFFMGLIKLLFNITDFNHSLKLATLGNRYNVDLKVSDIYDKDDERVDILFKEFTAAYFAKIENSNYVKKEDIINSLIHLIAENIGLLSCFIADKVNIKNLVFCGGFTINNKILKKALTRICRIQQKKPFFFNNAEFMGAIGALFHH